MAIEIGSMQIVLSADSASYSQSLDQASKKLDQLTGKAQAVGHATVSSTQAASGALRLLEGNLQNNIRAVEKFITTIPGVGAALKLAFPLVGGIAFAGMLVEMGTRVYEFQKKLQGIPADIQKGFGELNRSTETAGVALDVINDKLAIAIGKIEHKPVNSIKLALDEDREAAYGFANAIDTADKKVRDLLAKNSTSGTWTQIGGFLIGDWQASTQTAEDNINGAFARVSKAQSQGVDDLDNAKPGDAAAVQAANRVRTWNALNQAIAETSRNLANARAADAADPHYSGKGEINDYEGAERQLKDQRHNFKGDAEKQDQTVQLAADEAAKQKADDAKSAQEKAAAAARAAATAALRNMEQVRQTQEQAGALGAKADLDYWNARAAAFKQGSTEYGAIQKKIAEDQKSLARSGEQYDAEVARGAEAKAKNADALDKAATQLDLAAGKITALQADERLAAAATAAFTAKIVALRAQLAGLQADNNTSPEDKRVRGAGIENQIDDVLGEQSTAEVQNKIRAANAAVAHMVAQQKDNEALDRLAALTSSNTTAMRALAAAHDVATGAISKHDQALMLLADHSADYAAQLAEVARQQANLDADHASGKLTADDFKTKSDELSGNRVAIEGAAQRTAVQDRWAVQMETATGGVTAALQELAASGRDTAQQFKSLTSQLVSGFNKTALDALTSKHGEHSHAWEALTSNVSRQIAAMSLGRGESMALGLAGVTGDKHSKVAALLGMGKGAKAPTGARSDPLWMRLADQAGPAGTDAAKTLINRIAPFPQSSLDAGAKAASSMGESAAASNGGLIGGFLKLATPFIPGFADGVSAFGGGMAWVGERGPELLHLPPGSNVIPNHRLGDVMNQGGDTHHWTIHVHGNSDPAQVRAQVRQGIAEAAPHLMAATHAQAADNKRRTIK